MTEIVFSDFYHLEPMYWISTPGRSYSDAELLVRLISHGDAMPQIESILKLRKEGTKYSHHEFDVLGAAVRLIYEGAF